MIDYRATLLSGGSRVAEADTPPPDLTGSELDVQARWFAGAFGSRFTTTDNRAVEIFDFGTWNHEAGPDFTAASVRVGDDPPRRGPIEIDSDVRDWDHHGHAANPAFDDTILHVFLRRPDVRTFTRTSSHRDVAQVLLRAAAPIRGAAPRTRLITDDAARASALLHASARHRLRRKATILAEAVRLRGRDDAWFEAIAIALGYKRNKLPFQLVAQRAGLAAALAPGGEGLLFGLAGFLETDGRQPDDPGILAALRALWDDWWDDRARLQRLVLPATQWNLAGIRPANHPHRRLGALHTVATNWPAIRQALEAADSKKFRTSLAALTHPFWDGHYTLAAAPLPKPVALIGAQRIADILLNIFYPIALLQSEDVWTDYVTQPGPPPATAMTTTAQIFFANDQRAFLRSAVHQQGLLQLQRDFDESPDPITLLDVWREATQPR